MMAGAGVGAGAGAGATTTRQQSNQFDELKTIVTTTLDKKGILAKTQAELRKHVFEVLCGAEQDAASNKENVAPRIEQSNINDKFAMALIFDFLSYHHLDYTLSLMNTESQHKLDCVQDLTRNEIATRLGLPAQKPSPDSSLLHQLVAKLFDNDVFRPTNSNLAEQAKLRPRTPVHSNTVADIAEIDISDITDINTHPLLLPITQKPNRFIQEADTHDTTERALDDEHDAQHQVAAAGNVSNDGSKEAKEAKETEKENEDAEQILIYEKQKLAEEEEMNDALKELLDSSSFNEGELENMQEELQRIKEMNKTMQHLKQQTSEFQNLQNEAAASSVTEYDDDDEFESEELELDALNIEDDDDDVDDDDDDDGDNDDDHEKPQQQQQQQQQQGSNAKDESAADNEQQDAETEIDIEEDIEEEEDIDEEIDEEIEIDAVSNDQHTNTSYSLKEEDELANNEQLENIADIILNVKNEKIDFQL